MRCFVILAGALAILSTAASGRLLQQDPLAQVALQTAPTSPLPVTVALTTSPDPALPLVAVPINRTAAWPAVLVPVPNAALAGTSAEKTTAAGNATAGPALRIPTFAELVLTANASANLTYLATIVDALGGLPAHPSGMGTRLQQVNAASPQATSHHAHMCRCLDT